MGKKNEAVDRFDWSGNKTHTEYYDGHGNKTGSSVDRYNWSGEYDHTDCYDKHGNKTGISKLDE